MALGFQHLDVNCSKLDTMLSSAWRSSDCRLSRFLGEGLLGETVLAVLVKSRGRKTDVGLGKGGSGVKWEVEVR